MWPEHGEALSHTLVAESVLAGLYSHVIDEWVTGVVPFVVPPALTAASEPPPDPSQVAQQSGVLDSLLDELILTGLSTLFALSLVEAMDGLGIDLPGLPDLGGGVDIPEIPAPVSRVFTEVTDLTRGEIEDAVARVFSDPYLRQQAEDYVETQRELVHATGPLIQEKVTAAVRDVKVAPTASEPTPTVEVFVERQRATAVAVLTPGSEELTNVAQVQGYQAAGVQNAAVIEAAKRSPDVLDKVWIATIDGKTRDSHFAADGQRAPLDGSFTVGGTTLAFPGDPTGPASEVRNCRCRVGVLAPDEEIPSDVDRHTERLNGRDSTARNRRGSQSDEIHRRAADGVVRAKDDPEGIGRTAAGGWVAPSDQEYDLMKFKTTTATATASDSAASSESELFRTFTDQPIAFIGIETSDGRMLDKEIELSFRTFPEPVMWTKQTGMGHMDAFTVGAIESARVDGDKLLASGYMLNSGEADEAAEQLAHTVTRPSVDLAATEWILTDENGKEISEEDWWDMPMDAKVIQTITKAELIGCTLVSTPAFGDTMLQLDPERASRDKALVASAAEHFEPRVYSAELFADPKLTEPTELQIDSETGRVFGHLACFGSCHRSVQANCVIAPHSPSSYSMFHTSPAVRLDNGTRLPVGRLTVGTGHAPDVLSGGPAMAHYDNTGACWALVRAYEDAHGIAISGVVAPWATPEQVEMALSSPLSGDWRDFGQGLDLIAALNVNTPGFVVRGREDSNGRPVALVASIAPGRGKSREDAQISAEALAVIVENAVSKALTQRETDAEIDALVSAAIEKVGALPEPEPEKTANDEIAEMIAAAGL